jgi:hypothetical protein
VTKRKQKTLSLSFQEKKFAAFALMSGTAFLSGESAADASIVTGTVNQTLAPVVGSTTIGIDFDNDGLGNELSFGIRSTSVSGGPTLLDFSLTLNSTAMVRSGSITIGSGAGAQTKPVPTILSGNTLIGPSGAGGGTWQTTPGGSNFVTKGTLQDYDASTGLAVSAGGWAGESQKFIGVAIALSSDVTGNVAPYPVHYGWIRVSVPSTTSGLLTVHDWAYESVAGQSIQTPGSSSVPEPGTLQVVALGGLGLVAWRRRRMQAN